MHVYKAPTREAGLNYFVNETRLIFETLGATIPEKIRVSIGYSPNSRVSAKSREIAVCIPPSFSRDDHWEIFVSPHCADNVAIFAALTHELIHTVTGSERKDHGPQFGKLARALGLDGPLTHTVPGQGWFVWAAPIVSSIEMPYAHIDLTARHKPKKPTPGIKLECGDCGWLARATMKHIEPFTHLRCPTPDCDGVLIVGD